jgi:uncharacterized membrane protein
MPMKKAERSPDVPSSAAIVYLDRAVEPNRSLSRRGMLVVLGVLAMFNLFTTGFMIVIGAYPAPIFLGADMIAVSFAFWVIDRRRTARTERVTVTSDRVEVYRAGIAAAVWSTAPGFTRVVLDSTDADLPRLRIASAGKFMDVGTHVGPDTRTELANALEAAIQSAKGERHPV